MSLQARPPGIYPAPKERRFAPIALVKSGVVGFVGVTQKGPTNDPVRLTDPQQFRDVFGRLPVETPLEASVKGFFDNGGSECYVLRVAHLQERGRGEIAKPASCRVRDEEQRLSLLVEAVNEGSWGNEIKVQVRRPEARVQSLLTLDIHEGDLSAKIQSTHGFRRGTVVQLRDEETGEVDYRVVTEVDGRDKRIHWRIDEPIARRFRSSAPTLIEPVEFEMEVRTLEHREVYKDLSLAPNSDNYVERVVNGQSRLIRVMDMRGDQPIAARYPAAMPELETLTAGADGIFNITPGDFIGQNIGPKERYGLAAFEANEDVDLLVIPDLFWCLEHSSGFGTMNDVLTVQQAMVTQAENLRDRFAILDFPNRKNYVHALQWRLLFDSPYAAFYFPWVVVEVGGRSVSIPPSGHVAGVYARCDQKEGVHRAPANEELEGVIDLEVLLRDGDIGYLNEQGVNCLKSFNKRGLRIWGARTSSSDPANRYINVRRTISAIIRSMSRDLQWVVFEPNHPRLWKSISHTVSLFLQELWKANYFKGRSPEEAYYVKCDAETNPPEIRDVGQVVVEVGVAPVRPAEFIVFRVAEETSDLGPGATA